MSNLQIFENAEFGKIRVVNLDGEAWFVGKDVAERLGYSEAAKAVREHVEDEDKGVSEMDTPGGKQKVVIINESGLYSLVLSSKLPNAKKFKRWVTSDVLPSIRKHGAYMTPETLQAAILNPDTMIKLCQQLKVEQEKCKALEEQAEIDKPKVVFANAVSTSNKSILVGELAKLLRQNGVEIGQNRLFQWMRENGYLIKGNRSDWNMPTQRAMEMGLFEIKETPVYHNAGQITVSKTTKITGSGQVYFVNLFLNEGKNLKKTRHEKTQKTTIKR